ncbi:hypothetical protein FNZ56_04580 [Pseudoluteimonas lycopersici]|uniref:Uncharacterized protein n=1 Tax=Pseudoluteimonas lycopersici TaxID=1324796 RepID=A0A516V3U3_9GAMM|nr:hypothetical protein [Lysobacter lycopersici]QDQ73195.1 hypothetical protein FNZ56_04580 [Lysobacter lycopersici]
MNLDQLLQEVASGRRGFQANGDSVNELSAFQSIAQLIIDAGNSGYLHGVIPRKESFTGNDFYSVVMVKGLTDLGNRHLDGDI